MNILLQIIGLSCFAILFTKSSGVVQKIKYWWYGSHIKATHTSWKPFDCPKCFSFWIAAIYFYFEYGFINAILLASICHIIAILTDKLLIYVYNRSGI